MTHLYMIEVGCPSCGAISRLVESRPYPVAIDREIELSATYCPECGTHLPSIGEEWDLREECEIDRGARPTGPTEQRGDE